MINLYQIYLSIIAAILTIALSVMISEQYPSLLFPPIKQLAEFAIWFGEPTVSTKDVDFYL